MQENTDGKLGDGTTLPRPQPVLVNTSDRFSQLVTGTQFACGLKLDGTVSCWVRFHGHSLRRQHLRLANGGMFQLRPKGWTLITEVGCHVSRKTPETTQTPITPNSPTGQQRLPSIGNK